MTTSWNPLWIGAFEAVFRPWMRRRISAFYVRHTTRDLPRDRRVILAANHVSWWDGFLLRELHREALVRHPLYTLMRDDQLRRYPFFARMGVIEISESPSAITRALRRLTSDSSHFWLSYFPQGSIWPSWKRPLEFRRGIEVFARAVAPCSVIPVALHLEPLANVAPAVFVGTGAPISVDAGNSLNVADVEHAVEHLLDDLMRILAADGESAGVAWASTREA